MTYHDADLTVLAKTLYGEARGEGRAGMEAVAHVILNRAKRGGWWGSTVSQVCLHPWQFSCWNKNDPNSKVLEALRIDTDKEPPAYLRAHAAAAAVMAGDVPDPTQGSTHYHADTILPQWAAGLEVAAHIGRHRFYNSAK